MFLAVELCTFHILSHRRAFPDLHRIAFLHLSNLKIAGRPLVACYNNQKAYARVLTKLGGLVSLDVTSRNVFWIGENLVSYPGYVV